ncbi:tetratricopeptide repeat protein, partial [uncultured Campylobacter sp.]
IANKLFSKACDLEIAEGCNNLGYLYESGKGVKKDKSMAKKYYGKACDLGIKRSCYTYKKLNEQGF